MWFEENHMNEPIDTLAASTLPTVRHDGWTGEKMAIFCETLAESAVVAEACDQAGMGISGAYAARRRNPVFAAAWDAALSLARERLADTLLARSMEGNVEQIYKDGELVGERHVLDNRLGLAILRRLDRLAETGMALHSNPAPFPGAGRDPGAAQQRSPAIRPRSQEFDWERMVGALHSNDLDEVARALSLLKGDKVEEVEDPLNRPPCPCNPDEEEEEGLDLSGRCWKDEIEEMWMTDFPPPAGFTGFESRPYEDDWDDEPYKRACTEEEAALLEGDRTADRAAERAEDEALRDAWFDLLREEQAADRHPGPFDAASGVAQDMLEPGPAFSFGAEEGRQAPDEVRGDGIR
jgi:hypothetical protein